jgi:ADP-ribose pyrophosphatase
VTEAGNGQGAPFDRADVETLREDLVWDGFWKTREVHLRHRRFDGAWSAPLKREVHCRGEAVGVLLYDPVLDVIGLVEQFRIGPWMRGDERPWMLELVAGLREPGEDPDQVARRETLEESGCEVAALLPLADYYSSPGGSDEYFWLFCARVDLAAVRALHGEASEHEDIRLHVVPVAKAIELMQAGRLANAHTLLALLWLQLHRDRVRAAWL